MQEIVRRCDLPVKKKGEMTPCGERVPDDTAISFTFEGVSYESDLCERHHQDLLDAVAPFIAASQLVRQHSGQAVRKALKGRGKGTFTTKDVRRWLAEQGRDVAPSGRLPNELIEEYKAAHPAAVQQ